MLGFGKVKRVISDTRAPKYVPVGRWFYMRPFKSDNEKADEENMLKILDHLDDFLIIVAKTGDKTGIYIMAEEENRSVMGTMEGIEIGLTDAPNVSTFSHYTKYVPRIHPAYSIIPKNMVPTSIYRSIGQTATDVFIALYVKKATHVQPIRSHLSYLQKGIDPNSFLRFIATPKQKISPLKQEKIQNIKEKLASKNLFVCTMITGTMGKSDERVIASNFPSKAFKPIKIKFEDAEKLLTARPKVNGSKTLALSDEEILSFFRMPSNTDVDMVEFEMGALDAKSSGMGGGEMSSMESDMTFTETDEEFKPKEDNIGTGTLNADDGSQESDDGMNQGTLDTEPESKESDSIQNEDAESGTQKPDESETNDGQNDDTESGTQKPDESEPKYQRETIEQLEKELSESMSKSSEKQQDDDSGIAHDGIIPQTVLKQKMSEQSEIDSPKDESLEFYESTRKDSDDTTDPVQEESQENADAEQPNSQPENSTEDQPQTNPAQEDSQTEPPAEDQPQTDPVQEDSQTDTAKENPITFADALNHDEKTDK